MFFSNRMFFTNRTFFNRRIVFVFRRRRSKTISSHTQVKKMAP